MSFVGLYIHARFRSSAVNHKLKEVGFILTEIAPSNNTIFTGASTGASIGIAIAGILWYGVR